MRTRGKRIAAIVVALACLALAGAAYLAYASTSSVFIQIDPRLAYLRVAPSDKAGDAVPLVLADLNLDPGDTIRIRRVGTFGGGKGQTTQQAAVFSRSAELLPPSELHRIPGAIDAGEDRVSGETFIGHLPTDIPEDFLIDDVWIRIPEGATHLFVAPPDTFFRDNKDPDADYGVRITKLPTSWWPRFLTP